MILAYLLLLTGLTISSVAIYYSVVGLTAIFSAAAVPIMIMGVSLEVAKLVCATWIKQHWARVPRLMKTYMVTAVTVLMLITSMGIFGFLSKAHNDQNLVSGDVQSKIAIYDEKINTAKENIESDRKQLKQMDEAVDQVMGRSTDEKGADKANAIRRSQAKERVRLQAEIQAEQKTIATITEERAPIAAEVRKVDAEVGPIKYIAAFLYGTAPDAGMLEQAVTWIIILIVIVFDPLAVIMLLASQMTFAWEKEQKNPAREVIVDNDELKQEVEPESNDGINPPDFLKRFKERVENRFNKPKEPEPVVEEPDNIVDDINHLIRMEKEIPEPVIDFETQDPITAVGTEIETLPVEEIIEEKIKEVYPDVELVKEEFVSPNAPGLDVTMDRPGDYLKPEEQITAPTPIPEAAPARNRRVMNSHLAVEADNVPVELGKAANSGFGNEFPSHPTKGDTYLRTDYLPNRLFKFNDYKWIEVDKANLDVYAYEEEYIKHLISEIEAGRYDPESLSDVEREQIATYLGKNAQ